MSSVGLFRTEDFGSTFAYSGHVVMARRRWCSELKAPRCSRRSERRESGPTRRFSEEADVGMEC
jgi:hypothetical protein